MVEDDVRFAAILCELARERDFQCIVAHNADDGVEAALRYTPSAVLFDINLPDHSGLAVLDRLKRNPTHAAHPGARGVGLRSTAGCARAGRDRLRDEAGEARRDRAARSRSSRTS